MSAGEGRHWGDASTVEVGTVDPTPERPERPSRPTRRRRPPVRRPVLALTLVLMLAVGFLAGVLVDRRVVAAAPPAAGEATPLVGTLASAGPGLLAVRTPDGRVVGVRTAPGTRVVRGVPLRGALPAGTPLEVTGFRDADGALTATEVVLPPG